MENTLPPLPFAECLYKIYDSPDDSRSVGCARTIFRATRVGCQHFVTACTAFIVGYRLYSICSIHCSRPYQHNVHNLKFITESY